MTNSHKHRVLGGFSLIELMIVVAIIGVLTAVAIPAYRQYSISTYRADVQSDLMDLSFWLERWHINNNTYVLPDGQTLPFAKSPREGTAMYTLALTENSATATTYTLEAVPQGQQATDSCGKLTIDQAGKQGAQDSGCWR
ncbi:MAG: type IV pilin protein [Natronospirillum sp.]